MKKIIVSIMIFSSISAYATDSIEVSRCKITSNTDAIVFDRDGNRIEQEVVIKQDRAVIFNQEKGLRGLNRFFELTAENDGLFNGSFISTGSAVEANKRPSKRLINTGLIEQSEASSKRLAVLETTDSAVSSKKFDAKLKILSQSGEPNIKIYKLECMNINN